MPNTAYLSSWLLLIITAGAVICSSIFERRLWCRYLCPIGGMNGLMGKLSMTEVRARQGVCQGERWCGVLVRAPIHTHPHPYADRRCPPAAGECTTYHCYKGGPPEPPEGLESEGCPLYSHPAQLTDNRNCVLCMECVKACPNRCAAYMRRAGRGACSRAASLAHGAAVGAPPPPTPMCVHCMRPPASCPRAAPRRSVEFRWRLPGVDLWTTHKATSSELSLMFMLLGAGGDGGRAQAEAGGGGGGRRHSGGVLPQLEASPPSRATLSLALLLAPPPPLAPHTRSLPAPPRRVHAAAGAGPRALHRNAPRLHPQLRCAPSMPIDGDGWLHGPCRTCVLPRSTTSQLV